MRYARRLRNFVSIALLASGIAAADGSAHEPVHAIHWRAGAVSQTVKYRLGSAISDVTIVEGEVLPDAARSGPDFGAVGGTTPMAPDGCAESVQLVGEPGEAIASAGAANDQSLHTRQPLTGFKFPDGSLLRWNSSLDKLLSRVPLPGQGWLRERHKNDPESTLGWDITCRASYDCGPNGNSRCRECDTNSRQVVPTPYRLARFYFLADRFYEFDLTFEPESYSGVRRSLASLGKAIETSETVRDQSGAAFDQQTAAWHTQYVDVYIKKRAALHEGILVIDYKPISDLIIHKPN